MPKITPPPGVNDIFPEEISNWYELEDTARRIFPLYGYGEIRTPIFEYTEVFQRGLGDETEVVKKEMYSFEDRGGRSLTLRPEGTAGVMRAMAATDAPNGIEHRVFYMGPMFRGERPAAGRKRQFHQIGVENAGRSACPGLDAECIIMLCHYLKEAGISGYNLLLNTRGVHSDRPAAEQALREYFAPHIANMCDDCKERYQRNIWRILDCKQEGCRKIIDTAPNAADFFSTESKDYFKRVCDLLADQNINFIVDPKLVRGLDYYVHTVFELTHTGLGGSNAIAGGGRYELTLPGLKNPLPGVGFAMGMERLLIVRETLNVHSKGQEGPQLFLASMGTETLRFNADLAMKLRQRNCSVALEYEEKSLKSQFRSADRLNAKFTLTIGDSELANHQGKIKCMSDGKEISVSLDADSILSNLNKN